MSTNKRAHKYTRKTAKRITHSLTTHSLTTHSLTTHSLKNKIVKMFIELLTQIKLHHRRTHSFAEHKSTDELYERLNKNIDRFIESLLGKDQSHIHSVSLRMDTLDAETSKDIKRKIHEYREFLIDMSRLFDSKTDRDLLNIRDEILRDMNQFLYLLSFK